MSSYGHYVDWPASDFPTSLKSAFNFWRKIAKNHMMNKTVKLPIPVAHAATLANTSA